MSKAHALPNAGAIDPRLADIVSRFTSRTQDQLWRSSLSRRQVLYFVLVSTAPLVLAPVLSPRIAPFAIMAGFGVLAIFGWRLLVWNPTRKGLADQLVATLVGAERCASCGYSLEGLIPESDGCLVCPECSACWLASRRLSIADTGWSQSKTPAFRAWLGWNSSHFIGPESVVDAKGRLVRVVEPLLANAESAGRPANAAQLRRARESLAMVRGRIFTPRFGFNIFVLVMISFQIVPMFTGRTRPPTLPGLPAWLDPIFLYLMCVGFGGFLYMTFLQVRRSWLGHDRHAADTSRRLLLLQNLCPACASSLEALAPDDQGHITCEVCRCAWETPQGPPNRNSASS